MYVLQMLSNVGGSADKAKYFTFFSLFSPDGIVAGDGSAMAGVAFEKTIHDILSKKSNCICKIDGCCN